MDYRIGGHNVRIIHDYEELWLDEIIPAFIPFKAKYEEEAKPLLRFTLERRMREVPAVDRQLVVEADTGNGITRLDKITGGGYQFLIRDFTGVPCALLITSQRFDECHCAIKGDEQSKCFGLNSALMISYAFSASFYDTLLIHASVVRHQGKAYAFIAESGTGKSTHVANWLNNIEDCDLINDDNPVIRLVDGQPVLFGSPWSGKTACYRNVEVPLGALLKIQRDTVNHVEPLSSLNAFVTLLTACSFMQDEKDISKPMCKVLSSFVSKVRMATLHCLPDADSAFVCRRFLED